MSKGARKHDGRSSAERYQRTFVERSAQRDAREREEAEDQEWAARSGPVTVSHKEPVTKSLPNLPRGNGDSGTYKEP